MTPEEISDLLSSMNGFSDSSTKLTKSIVDVKTKASLIPPVITPEDFEPEGKFPFMTENQIMKRIMTIDSGTITGVQGVAPSVDEETAHYIIYGKPPIYDANGKMIDNEKTNPECVETNRTVPINFNLKQKIKDMKKEIKDSIMQVQFKSSELSEAFAMLIVKLGLGMGVMIDCLTTIPKPIITVALAALQGMLLDISNFVSKTMEITPFLLPLMSLAYFLPSISMIKTIFVLITVPIDLLTGILQGVSKILILKEIIMSLVGALITVATTTMVNLNQTNEEIKTSYPTFVDNGTDNNLIYLEKELVQEQIKTPVDDQKVEKLNNWINDIKINQTQIKELTNIDNLKTVNRDQLNNSLTSISAINDKLYKKVEDDYNQKQQEIEQFLVLKLQKNTYEIWD